MTCGIAGAYTVVAAWVPWMRSYPVFSWLGVLLEGCDSQYCYRSRIAGMRATSRQQQACICRMSGMVWCLCQTWAWVFAGPFRRSCSAVCCAGWRAATVWGWELSPALGCVPVAQLSLPDLPCTRQPLSAKTSPRCQ